MKIGGKTSWLILRLALVASVAFAAMIAATLAATSPSPLASAAEVYLDDAALCRFWRFIPPGPQDKELTEAIQLAGAISLMHSGAAEANQLADLLYYGLPAVDLESLRNAWAAVETVNAAATPDEMRVWVGLTGRAMGVSEWGLEDPAQATLLFMAIVDAAAEQDMEVEARGHLAPPWVLLAPLYAPVSALADPAVVDFYRPLLSGDAPGALSALRSHTSELASRQQILAAAAKELPPIDGGVLLEEP